MPQEQAETDLGAVFQKARVKDAPDESAERQRCDQQSNNAREEREGGGLRPNTPGVRR